MPHYRHWGSRERAGGGGGLVILEITCKEECGGVRTGGGGGTGRINRRVRINSKMVINRRVRISNMITIYMSMGV